MKKSKLGLSFIWGLRLKFRDEGIKLQDEGDKLWENGDPLCAEGEKICAEAEKLWAEGRKLCADGDKLWAEGILAAYGNIKLEWKNYNHKKRDCECHLETGEVFKP